MIGGKTMDIKIGDLVGRRSYNFDVVFRVHDIVKQNDKIHYYTNRSESKAYSRCS